MPKQSVQYPALQRDGTSQAARALPALNPDYVSVDERSLKDLLCFAREYSKELKYFNAENQEMGDWSAFLDDDVDLDAVVSFINDPEQADAATREAFSQPHFVLFLTFLKLLREAQKQLNTLTRRHLDFYFREVLRMQKKPAEPDRVNVLLQLQDRFDQAHVPKGTRLNAGADSLGRDLIYKTERDIVVSRAGIAQLNTVFAEKQLMGISEARASVGGTRQERFVHMLYIALGDPLPGDPLAFNDILRGTAEAVDFDYLSELGQLLAFSEAGLFMPLFDLRALMKLKRQRDDAGGEWDQINHFLEKAARKKRNDPGFQFDPADASDFAANLIAALEGPPDFRGITEVDHIDHLYEQRNRIEVRDFIRNRLYFESVDDFVRMMQIKVRIDREWEGINKILEEAGRRKRSDAAFRLSPLQPADFTANLNKAVGPLNTPLTGRFLDIDAYFTAVEAVESDFFMSAENFVYLMQVGGKEAATAWEWKKADEILLSAHREKVYSARREVLQGIRSRQGLTKMFHTALGEDPLTAESNPLSRLKPFVKKDNDFAFLEDIAKSEKQGGVSVSAWTRVARIVEMAQRFREGFVPPTPYKETWLNLYPAQDATQAKVTTATEENGDGPRWKTFGRPVADAAPDAPPDPVFGVGLTSPMLMLSEGRREVILTFGFREETFLIEKIRPLFPSLTEEGGAGSGPLQVEVSTEKGWVAPDTLEIKFGAYTALTKTPDENRENLQALQLKLIFSEVADPIAPFAEQLVKSPWPLLRIMMRQVWDVERKQFVTRYAPFKALAWVKIHTRVAVSGLTTLQLQNDNGVLDAKKPFEPFGGTPSVGSRFYVGHPELLQKRLDRIQFHIEWMGAPEKLKDHYKNYGIDARLPFTAKVSLVDRRVQRPLKDKAGLFAGLTNAGAPHAVSIPEPAESERGVVLADKLSPGGFQYDRDVDGNYQGELTVWSRFLQWELNAPDFQHAAYPGLAARKSLEMAAAISNKTPTPLVPASYQVNPPYTPKVKKLSVEYAASREVVFQEKETIPRQDRLFHLHPFGISEVRADGVSESVSFLPQYDHEGELYIGIKKIRPPQTLSLLFQMAEGSADPDLEPAPVTWSVLSGDQWTDLGDGGILSDGTRGLINSGIITFSLKAARPNTLLPGDLYWLRAAIPVHTNSVCDTVAIHAQAVSATFSGQGNAPDHLDQPLPAESITDLAEPLPGIAGVAQPYTSFGGKMAEADAMFHTRVSERLRHKQRAVSIWDYEHLVLERFPQIYKVKCLPASLLSHADAPGRVEIVVIPDIRNKLPFNPFEPKAPADLIAEIKDYLSNKHPPYARIKVKNAHYIPVKVRFGVRFKPGVDERYAKKILNDALNRFLSPWAYEEGADIVIGGKIYANSLINFLDRQPYIDYVVEMKLFSSADGVNFKLALPSGNEGYFVAADRPDGVLVAARRHEIDIISEEGYEEASFTGLNYMKVELDFMVG
ncbi:MAG: baseplate J/gp47 family protein [Nitrospiria bacterium]